ncbi:MAG TPA: GDSL-type esterase/lipase family protein, partial [Opitutaceae bacterium]|nr:GDSL-type esterase/lipase family protein [Opitutaceae bacterium]
MTLATAAAIHAATPDPTVPVRRTIEYDWMSVAQWNQMHAEDVAIAEKGGVDVLFLGDSITAGWANSPIWANEIAPLHAANFGIGGDSTQNVLWRLQHGTIGNLQPRLVVLLIGTNNLGRDQHSPAEVVRGIQAILTQVKLAWPSTKILVYG